MTRNGRPPTIKGPALELAARPQGVNQREIVQAIGCAPVMARNALCVMLRDGRVHASAGKINRRYFTTPEAAAAYVQPPRPAQARKPQKSRAKPKHLHQPRGPKPGTPSPKKNALAPTKTHQALTISQPKPRTTKPEEPVIVPPHVKVQVLPSAPVYSRHQLPPGERVIGGFASMGPGRYLDSMA